MPTDIRSKLLALVSATLAGATLSACSSSTQQAPAATAHTPTMQQGAGQAGSCSGHPPAATPAAAPAAGGQAASCSATGSCGAAQPADAGTAR